MTNCASLLVATHHTPLFHLDIIVDADGLPPPITIVIFMVEVAFGVASATLTVLIIVNITSSGVYIISLD